MSSSLTRLAVYGTLAPGRANHHHLAMIDGRWFSGFVRGTLVQAGWGADMGYPGLIPDPEGDSVDVMVLEADDLPAHWDRLDAFEGEEYERIVIEVESDAGTVLASIYVIRDKKVSLHL